MFTRPTLRTMADESSRELTTAEIDQVAGGNDPVWTKKPMECPGRVTSRVFPDTGVIWHDCA